jgi:hypothetical protein
MYFTLKNDKKMITKFDTSGGGKISGSSKGMGIFTWLLIGGALFAGYKFVLKPYLDKRNKKQENGED